MGAVAYKKEVDYKPIWTKIQKPNYKYDIEDEWEWFQFLHEDSEPTKCVQFAFIDKAGTFIPFSIQVKNVTTELLQSMSNNAYDLGYNMYISPAITRNYSRQTDTAWSSNCIILDLDYYKLEEYKHLSPAEFVKQIDYGEYEPSMTACSGRGVYLVYKLSQKQALGTNKAVASMQQAKDALIKYFAKYNCDNQCRDVTHVFRAIGSRHLKKDAVRETYIISKNNKKYTIKALFDSYSETVPDRVFVKTEQPKIYTPNTKPVTAGHFAVYTKNRPLILAEERIEDLYKLMDLREGHFGIGEDEESCRNHFLHLVAIHLFYMMKSEAEVWNEVELLNSKLSKPLPLCDLRATVKRAMLNNEKRGECKKIEEALIARAKTGEYISKEEQKKAYQFYRYKNTTIIALLGVTDEEARHMKQLVTTTVKKERRAEYDAKRYETEKQERAEAKTTKQDGELALVSAMMNNNLTNEQIAEQLGCSIRKVQRLKKQIKEA